MGVEVMKLYKPKKGDGKELMLIFIFAILFAAVIVWPLSNMGITSIDELLIPAFVIVGFISFIGGIFSKLLWLIVSP